VKANQGWRAVRVTARQEGQIVAGAQILLQALPLIGSVGYLFNGPLFVKDDPALHDLMTRELKQIAKAYHILILIVQPPKTAAAYAETLPNNDFTLGKIKIALSATTVLDTSPDLETILAQMKSKTRYNIRLSKRKGITVRAGTEADIPVFHQLLTETGKRQNFTPSSEEYFANMMRILGPHDYFKLFFAEYEGEPVSAMLAIPFGDTVIYKRGAWAGAHGDKRPNEAMHWAAIQWVKSQGYRFYDFDGIEPPVAELILQNESVPREMLQSVTRFKLGFTTGVVLLPPPYEYVYNPILGWGYNHMYPRLARSPRVKRLIKQLRHR
jgi:lipid II:glycine glycyltransferase (peptidoglycan interpeptide bridge formation enzyme)